MSLALVWYLVGVVSGFKVFFGVFSVCMGFVYTLLTTYCLTIGTHVRDLSSYDQRGRDLDDEVWPYQILKNKALSLCTALAISLAILLPSVSTSKEIIALYYGEKVLTSPQVTEIGEKGLNVINRVLDNYLEDKPLVEENVQ